MKATPCLAGIIGIVHVAGALAGCAASAPPTQTTQKAMLYATYKEVGGRTIAAIGTFDTTELCQEQLPKNVQAVSSIDPAKRPSYGCSDQSRSGLSARSRRAA